MNRNYGAQPRVPRTHHLYPSDIVKGLSGLATEMSWGYGDYLASKRALENYERMGTALKDMRLKDALGWGAQGLTEQISTIPTFGDVASLMKGAAFLAPTVYHGGRHKWAPTKNNPLGEIDLDKTYSGEGGTMKGFGSYWGEQEAVGKNYKNAGSWDPPKITTGGKEIPRTGNTDESLAGWALYDMVQHYPTATTEELLGMVRRTARNSNMYSREERGIIERMLDKWEKQGIDIDMPGYLYRGWLDDDAAKRMIDLDRPLEYQDEIIDRLKGTEFDITDDWLASGYTGNQFIKEMEHYARNGWYGLSDRRSVSEWLRKQGIPGAKFRDQFSRGLMDPSQETFNYVIYDPDVLDVTKRMGNNEDAIFPFKRKSERAEINRILRDPEYFKKEKHTDIIRKLMTPDEYIDASQRLFRREYGISREDLINSRMDDKIPRYLESMKKGEAFPSLSLDYGLYGRKSYGQEGLHRAIVVNSKEFQEAGGIPLVPVITAWRKWPK